MEISGQLHGPAALFTRKAPPGTTQCRGGWVDLMPTLSLWRRDIIMWRKCKNSFVFSYFLLSLFLLYYMSSAFLYPYSSFMPLGLGS
jgi:hypothetical protein